MHESGPAGKVDLGGINSDMGKGRRNVCNTEREQKKKKKEREKGVISVGHLISSGLHSDIRYPSFSLTVLNFPLQQFQLGVVGSRYRQHYCQHQPKATTNRNLCIDLS